MEYVCVKPLTVLVGKPGKLSRVKIEKSGTLSADDWKSIESHPVVVGYVAANLLILSGDKPKRAKVQDAAA